MDPNTLKAFIRLISKEKDLPPEILKEAIEHAILSASRKQLSLYQDAVANLDIDTGVLTVTVTKTIVEDKPANPRHEIALKDAKKQTGNKKLKAGEEIRINIEPSEFGRIAAQSARQMVMQRLRDAERIKVFAEYKDKEGIMVTGVVSRFERRDVMINIGKAEAVLPATEQPMGAHYKINDRIKVLILRVEDTTKGPNIILSRKAPQLVLELFKQEVPEIADGTVQIVGIAREAGVRTKIAVRSVNSDVDPVGACVGMKGSRVQMVVRELENEKIDIVPWSNDSLTFIRNALNPAKIVGIELDNDSRRANVTVAQGNLAIAIGRKGQNTKLAAKLTGYRLDIRSENEEELAYEEIQRRYLEDFLSQIEGLSELYQEALLRSSFNSVEKIAKAEPAKLLPFTGDSDRLVASLITGAQEYLDALHEMEQERKRLLTVDGEGEGGTDEGDTGEASDETPDLDDEQTPEDIAAGETTAEDVETLARLNEGTPDDMDQQHEADSDSPSDRAGVADAPHDPDELHEDGEVAEQAAEAAQGDDPETR